MDPGQQPEDSVSFLHARKFVRLKGAGAVRLDLEIRFQTIKSIQR